MLAQLSADFPNLAETAESPEIATMLQEAGIRVFIEDGNVVRIKVD
jgi:hypothetical protein